MFFLWNTVYMLSAFTVKTEVLAIQSLLRFGKFC